ncbi:OsmC family protein [Luteolibacter yonseiensis]|uniref:OsmC family protein n=1 Tax=Luteolibacter yonseiensis TaxID=1144680 RepID=A0A934R1S9_9BACT|nr:OsmC family protein [Luteolibacter yonseiensis]MBK1815381.1 OsmC family protein [Luteolibacter yonseiensis]
MKRTANAGWTGSLKDGSGTLGTQSHVLHETPYSFRSRFGDGKETNPEELIAAAHAGCFSMALALSLDHAGYPPESIATRADLTFDPGALAITAVHLTLTAKIPGITDEAFQEIAVQAKSGCPVSKVLRADITLSAVLEA